MEVAIWIVQILTAIAFFFAGIGKLTQSREALIERGMKYVEDLSLTQVRMIGTLEVLGALGLILPSLLNILPVLTPLAGIGLVIVMLGAMLTHLRRGETPMIAVNLVLLLMAAFVAYGRFVLVPIA